MFLHYNNVFCFASFSTLIDFFGGFFSLIDRKYVADFSETAASKMSDLPTSPSARLSDTEPDTPSSRVSCPLFFNFLILFYHLSSFPLFHYCQASLVFILWFSHSWKKVRFHGIGKGKCFHPSTFRFVLSLISFRNLTWVNMKCLFWQMTNAVYVFEVIQDLQL